MNITPSSEVTGLPRRKLEYQLLDKRRDVIVGLNSAFPLLDSKHFLGNFNFQILFHRCLARQPPTLVRLSPGEMTLFRRQ